MKLFIASDIHGSALYCEQMLESLKKEQADQLILLGDILYHGPRNDLPDGHAPKKVIEMLNPLSSKITCVRGNCEAEVDQMVLSFPVMDDYNEFSYDDLHFFATHGHLYNPNKLPTEHMDSEHIGSEKTFILLNGHTHVPAFEKYENFYYVNPGSVSIPKENSEHSYLVYENRTFTWKSLDGTVYMEKCI